MAHLSDMLQGEIDNLGDHAKLVSPDWIPIICNRRAIPSESPMSYLLHPLHHCFLHRQGELLVRWELLCLAGTTNLNDCHWISFVVNSQSRSILIGDSMFHGGPDGLKAGSHAEVIKCLQWFLHQSNSRASLDTTPYTTRLSTSRSANDP